MALKSNIFDNIPDLLPDELVTQLCTSTNVRIERIVSDGHSSDVEQWYDQDQSEFVVLLDGSGVLEFEDGVIKLQPGDYINIPAHRRHRVAATDATQKTIWLCVFY